MAPAVSRLIEHASNSARRELYSTLSPNIALRVALFAEYSYIHGTSYLFLELLGFRVKKLQKRGQEDMSQNIISLSMSSAEDNKTIPKPPRLDSSSACTIRRDTAVQKDSLHENKIIRINLNHNKVLDIIND